MHSAIYAGIVRHRRFSPVRHEFRAPLFMMYLDLAELPTVFRGSWFWSVERMNIATFRRRDHVGDRKQPLAETIRALVEAKTGHRPRGPIRLLTHLSYFGYCFNPLSVFFCFDETGDRLQSVVAEVTNTPWGERQCYVLSTDCDGDESATETPTNSTGSSKHDFQFPKSLHVSPFMEMNFQYHWHLTGPGQQLILHTENCREGETTFDATLTLTRIPISTRTLAWALVRYPLMTIQVVAKIHWHALRLWWKGVPYVPHPKARQPNEPGVSTP